MSLQVINDLSNYSQWLGSFVIMSLVLASFKGYDGGIRILGLMGLVSVVLQFLQTGSQLFFGVHYLNAIGDCYVFLESLLFLAFYYILFTNNRYLRLALIGSAFIIVSIYSMVLFGDATYPWYAVLSATRNILLILFSVVTFFKLLTDLPNNNLLSLPLFWINSSILFYFSCTFMLSLTMDYIAQVLKDDFQIFWTFKNFLRAGFCVVICIGIWKARKLPT
jgi:hypothetical protein